MEEESVEPVSMFRFVVVFIVVKIALSGAWWAYVYFVENRPPISSTVSSIAILLAAIVAAVLWFAKTNNRPMLRTEIIRFSLGNFLADLALSFAWVVGMIWLMGAPASWEGVSMVIGGDGDPNLAKFALVVGLTAGLVQVVALSALFGQFITKNLPDKAFSSKNL